MTEARRHAQVINVDEVSVQGYREGSRFGCSYRNFTDFTGAQGVGCTWYEVEPGRRAFPRHYHCANEEAIYVLDGAGTLRIGSSAVELRAGDFVTLPVGPDFAHELANTGTGPLRYLCFSTLLATDVVGYPDSGKIGAYALPAGLAGKPWVRARFREASKVGYFDGEDVG
jgi:uncharacterized cupin superfamily protein